MEEWRTQNKYLYHKLRYSWLNHPEDREEIIQQYIRGIQDGRIDPSNPLPHGAPNQHLPSQWDAETWFDNMGEWPGWAENRHRFNPFTGQEEKDPQLEESIKRTKMSALRTGLAGKLHLVSSCGIFGRIINRKKI